MIDRALDENGGFSIDQPPHRHIWWWCAAAFLIGLLFRLIPLFEKQYFAGDEIRAYLAATAHEGEYRILLRAAKAPIATWATVHDWTRMIEPEAGLGYGAVARDLAMWDIHPPLYFWLLHGWTRLFGVTFWAGALLNLLLEGLILALIVMWGRAITRQSQTALWLGVLWWLHPLTVRVSPLTRAYVLLTLITLLFAVALYFVFYKRQTKGHRLLASAALIVTAVLGLLTHYLFLFILATSIFVLAIKYSQQQWRVIFHMLLLLTTAFLLFLWIYPDFFWAFTFLLEKRPDFWAALPKRMGRTVFIGAALYGPMMLCLLMVWGLQASTLQRGGATKWRPISRWRGANTYIFGVAMLAWLPVLGTALFYILLISPHHAMGAQYMNFVTPFVALITLRILHQSRRMGRAPIAFAALLVAFNLVQLHPALRDFGLPPRLQPADLATDGAIVFDNPASVHWFNVALHLDETQPVYVASQSELLAHPAGWLTRLENEGGLYLAFVLHNPTKAQSTLAGRERIVALLAAKTEVNLRTVLTPLHIGSLYIYTVTPKQ